MKRIPALMRLLELGDDFRKPGRTFGRQVWYEKINSAGMERAYTGHESHVIKDLEWANIAFEWFPQVKKATLVFVMLEMMPRLKNYNLLWHYPTTRNKAKNQAIKNLIDNKIMYRTEVTSIYILNPIKIWKGGNPLICIEETKDLLRAHRKPSVDIITDRRPGDKYTRRTSEENFHISNDSMFKYLGVNESEMEIEES